MTTQSFYRHLLLIGLATGLLLLFGTFLTVPDTPAQPARTTADTVDLTTAVMQVAKRNIPAVVHIAVTERQEVSNPFTPFDNDPMLRRFFNTPPHMPEKFKRDITGLGTGMLIDPGPYLTNYHVAGGASKIDVLLANGQSYTARVIGGDPKTDLAVLKVDVKDTLPTVIFGDSDPVEVGEWVIAIGHPRGLDHTVTHGIISAKHRRGITEPSSYQDFLQTDAAINPGNSGGPLLNLRGEVIGINTAIASQTGGFEGIGFAIPSNMAVHVARELMAHGKVERAWLGVSVQDVTPEIVTAAALTARQGAVIMDVVKGSPAEQAGLKKDDVILTYRGKDIPNASTLRNAVATTPISTEVPLTVWRHGQQQELIVKVRNLAEATPGFASAVKTRLGVAVRPVTKQEVQKYGLATSQGVAITHIEPKSPLGKVGFETHDILLAINDESIDSVESLLDLVATLNPRQRITVVALDHRSGDTGSVQVVVP